MAPRERKDELTYPTRREGIRGDTAGLGIDGPPGGEGLGERGRGFRLDADDGDPACIPGGNAADEPTTADGNEQRIDGRGLLLELEADAALARRVSAWSKAWTGKAPDCLAQL